jgi:hypothetical protein
MVQIIYACLQKDSTRVSSIPADAYVYEYSIHLDVQATTTEYVRIQVYINGKQTYDLQNFEITPSTVGVNIGLYGGVPGTEFIATLNQLLNFVGTPNANQLSITVYLGSTSTTFTVPIVTSQTITITKMEVRYKGNVVTSIDNLDSSCVWYELWVYVNCTATSTINARIHITINGTEVWYQKFSVPPGASTYKFEFCQLGYKFNVSTVGDLIRGLGNPSSLTICATWELL